MIFDSLRKIVGSKKSAVADRGAEITADGSSNPLGQTPNYDAVEKTSPTTGSTLASDVKIAFDKVARRIAKKEPVKPDEILPYLCLEKKDDRVYVNYQLGCVYHYAGDMQKAGIFIERAWLLSGFDMKVMESFKTIQIALNNTPAIREAHKRIGLAASERGDVGLAIEQFDQAHFTYGFIDHIDRWEYDYDIMAAVDRLAAQYRHPEAARPTSSRIKIGYLLRGLLEVNSILIRHTLSLVEFHDKTQFEVFCFAPEMATAVGSSAQGAEVLQKFKNLGCQTFVCPDLEPGSHLKGLLAVAEQIRSANIDVLVTTAGLVDYSQYFLCALKPAPIVVGLVQGPPAQFAPPSLDWCIAWSRHPLMDTPVDCSLIRWKGSASATDCSEHFTKADFNIPEDACVILSGGRLEKFQEQMHWRAIAETLVEHKNAYYVAAGPADRDVPFIEEIFSEETRQRVLCLGWRTDFLKLLGIADIVLDTYPNGGGQSLVEAMSAQLPIVSHRNNFMKLFDQTSWSPVEDFISDNEMLVERGDFASVKALLGRMIENKEYRQELGKRCGHSLLRSRSEDAVAACEQIFKRLVETKKKQNLSVD